MKTPDIKHLPVVNLWLLLLRFFFFSSINFSRKRSPAAPLISLNHRHRESVYIPSFILDAKGGGLKFVPHLLLWGRRGGGHAEGGGGWWWGGRLMNRRWENSKKRDGSRRNTWKIKESDFFLSVNRTFFFIVLMSKSYFRTFLRVYLEDSGLKISKLTNNRWGTRVFHAPCRKQTFSLIYLWNLEWVM